ncbi:MAG: hypothetical protein ACKVZH_07440 [Blastocatellia bacterium]
MALERAISHWAESVLGEPEPLEAIAVDGKALKGATKQVAQDTYLLTIS